MPYRYLFPAIVLFCAIGVYSTNNNTFDIWMVGIFGVIQAHALLLEALKDPNPGVLAAAAFGCGHHRSLDAVEPLIALSAHACDGVRLGVAFGLCFREDERAVER